MTKETQSTTNQEHPTTDAYEQLREVYAIRNEVSEKLGKAVWANVIDPLVMFSALLQVYAESEEENPLEVEISEIARAMRLMVVGGYAETMMLAQNNGKKHPFTGSYGVSHIMKDWQLD